MFAVKLIDVQIFKYMYFMSMSEEQIRCEFDDSYVSPLRDGETLFFFPGPSVCLTNRVRSVT